MPQMIHLLAALAAGGSMQVLSGCNQAVALTREYTAVIQEIKYPAGTYFSPSRGAQPSTEIYVRVVENISPGKPAFLKITALGPYSRSVDGDIGNVVSFSYAGDLRFRDTISIDQLANYRKSR